MRSTSLTLALAIALLTPACVGTCYDVCASQSSDCLREARDPGQEYVCEQQREQCASSCPEGAAGY